jgi:uncharacterized SAM-binding protein YcdF (DUF218 family)
LKHKVRAILIVVTLGIFIFWILFHAGDYLVVNHPERSDVIVVLAGDHNDQRYWRGLELLREGYGQQMFVDASADHIYGRSYAEYAADFVARSAGDQSSKIRICTITNDSTVQEAADVRRCLEQVQPMPTSALVVTNDYHTRRALAILNARVSQYHWFSAAVNDKNLFGRSWWQNREWAKTFVYEGEKLLWWRLFESWQR